MSGHELIAVFLGLGFISWVWYKVVCVYTSFINKNQDQKCSMNDIFHGRLFQKKLSIRDLRLHNKKVLLRVDFNVPLDNGVILDDARIRSSLPTIQYALAQGASLILMSHLGRPSGGEKEGYSLEPCAERLAELLQKSVKMAKDCVGPEIKKMTDELKPGELLLLENLRFHPGEERPEREPGFASALADLGDCYVNDAFASAHRPHASITELPKFFPQQAAMGFLMEKEVAYLGLKLREPTHPFCAILGGAKISTKFKVIESLMQKADVLLIGGAMAFTFFKAEQIPVGSSPVEDSFLAVAREILDVGHQSRCRLMLPIDLVIARGGHHLGEWRIVKTAEGIPPEFVGVDIGPETIEAYCREIKQAGTIFWNGPLGIFEEPPFDKGTCEIAKSLAVATKGATTIVGGGETLAALEKTGFAHDMSHVSTGGGAALEYIEFGELPGVEALSDRPLEI